MALAPSHAAAPTVPSAPPVSTAQAVPDETEAQATPSPFMQLRQAAVQAAKAKRWDDALTQARALVAMTLPDGNPYEQLDASELLSVLQHQQGLYRDNMALADRMLAAAERRPDEAVSGQVEALAQRGLMAAVMAGDAAAVVRYQQVLLAKASLFPAQWTWDRQAQRLAFQSAGLSVPTALERWVLMAVEPAQDRTDASSLRYMYVLPDGKRMFATLRLRYEDAQNAQTQAAREQRLTELLAYTGAASDGVPIAWPQVDLRMPADTPSLHRALRVTSKQQPDAVHLDWVALRGNWFLQLEVQMLQSQQAQGLQALQAWWQAVDGPQGPDLPRSAGQALLPSRESAVTSAWRGAQDWPRAAQLARAAVGDARFPSEVARLNTVVGIAAFKAGQYAQADAALQTALQAWPYAKVFDSTLIDNAQQYGALLALRRGDQAQAAALLRQYLRNAGGLDHIWYAPDDVQQAWLDNRRTGMGLPMQAAGFVLQEPQDWRRIHYRDLATEFTLGLTSGQRIPESDAQQEALLRKALTQQFQLQPGALRKQRFVAKQAAAGQPARQGQYWVFEVQPVADAPASQGAPVRQVLLWLVDQGESRAILRASVTNAQQARQAQQLAEALRW